MSKCWITVEARNRLPSVEDVHEGNGKDVGLLGTGQVGDVGVERDTLLSSTGLGDSQGDTENGVSSELGLVGGSIEVDEELVDLGLVLDIKVLLDQSRGNDGVDVLNSLGDTLASPLGLVTIAELAGLVLACSMGSISFRYFYLSAGVGCEDEDDVPVEAPEGTMAR